MQQSTTAIVRSQVLASLRSRRMGAVLALCALFTMAGYATPVDAQATVPVSVTLSFVNQYGGPGVPPPGNVQIIFTPVVNAAPPGISPVTLTATTIAPNSQSLVGSLVGGATYSFEEVLPPGITFLSASALPGSGGSQQPLSNGGSLVANPGVGYTINVVDQVGGQVSPGTAPLTITLNFVSATGQPTPPASGSAAGVVFTLTPVSGTASGAALPQSFTTSSASGSSSAIASGSPPSGAYTFTEALPSGACFLSATVAQGGYGVGQQPLTNGGTLSLVSGASTSINVINQLNSSVCGQSASSGGTATLTVFVSLTTATGQATTGNLSGYSFTLTGPTGATQTQTTTEIGQATFANILPGVYSLAETSSAGTSFSSMTINGVSAQQQQQFQVQAGGTYDVDVTNVTGAPGQATGLSVTPAAVISLGATRTVSLANGCNNIVNTFPDGTPGQAVASAVTPASSVVAVWRYDNTAQVFRAAYFATPPGSTLAPPTDISSLNRLDAIFVCVSSPGTLTEPDA
jgi:hypothetical protein